MQNKNFNPADECTDTMLINSFVIKQHMHLFV